MLSGGTQRVVVTTNMQRIGHNAQECFRQEV